MTYVKRATKDSYVVYKNGVVTNKYQPSKQ